jgi:hypothetical protein
MFPQNCRLSCLFRFQFKPLLLFPKLGQVHLSQGFLMGQKGLTLFPLLTGYPFPLLPIPPHLGLDTGLSCRLTFPGFRCRPLFD